MRLGVGLFIEVVGKIFLSWIVTLPVGALLSITSSFCLGPFSAKLHNQSLTELLSILFRQGLGKGCIWPRTRYPESFLGRVCDSGRRGSVWLTNTATFGSLLGVCVALYKYAIGMRCGALCPYQVT